VKLLRDAILRGEMAPAQRLVQNGHAGQLHEDANRATGMDRNTGIGRFGACRTVTGSGTAKEPAPADRPTATRWQPTGADGKPVALRRSAGGC
jgi:hypothetical protein